MCDVYIYTCMHRQLVTACVCVCVCTCWASITSPWTSHTHIHTKQPAYGRHRKTYFPLKTYNAGVRQCVVCCVVLRWGRRIKIIIMIIKKKKTPQKIVEKHTKIILVQVCTPTTFQKRIFLLIIKTADWNANFTSFWEG